MNTKKSSFRSLYRFTTRLRDNDFPTIREFLITTDDGNHKFLAYPTVYTNRPQFPYYADRCFSSFYDFMIMHGNATSISLILYICSHTAFFQIFVMHYSILFHPNTNKILLGLLGFKQGRFVTCCFVKLRATTHKNWFLYHIPW